MFGAFSYTKGFWNTAAIAINEELNKSDMCLTEFKDGYMACVS